MNDSIAHQAARINVDLALLGAAGRLLEQSHFTVASDYLSPARLPWLLAENGLFALGVVAAHTLDDLVALESFATSAIADRIREAGPKRWDAYLVLLAREGREARGTRAVRDLQDNTRLLRRVVQLGVHADEESVRSALRPFLPLPPPIQHWPSSPIQDLEDELVLQGIEPDRAREAVLGFQGLWSA